MQRCQNDTDPACCVACKQYYSCSWSSQTENVFGYEMTFVILMEIKHQHWAIYLPLRTTHKSTSLLTPEALAKPQNILPRATMPSSGCNIFNNNIAELSSREACCILWRCLNGSVNALAKSIHFSTGELKSVWRRCSQTPEKVGVQLKIHQLFAGKQITMHFIEVSWQSQLATAQKMCYSAGLVVIGPTELN